MRCDKLITGLRMRRAIHDDSDDDAHCWLVLMMIERLCERLRSVQSQDSGAAGGQPAVSPARVGRSAQCSPVNCYNRLTPPHLPDHRLRCY